MTTSFVVYQYDTIGAQDNGIKNGSDASHPTVSVVLSPICSCLNEVEETVLRNQLLRRITNGSSSGEGTGGVISAQLPNFEKQCGIYFHLVANETVRDHDYVVCIVDERKEILDSFSAELDRFLINHVKPLLSKPHDEEALTLKMTSWPDHTTERLRRGVLLLREILSDVLTITFINGELDLSALSQDDATSIHDVFDMASVFRRRDGLDGCEKRFSVDQDADGVCRLVHGQRPLDGDVSYFDAAAKEVMEAAEESDVVKIKQVIHNHHIKTAHDLNTVKRLVDQARNDYYALFRLHVFLEQNRSQHLSLFHCFLEMEAFNEEEKTILSLLQDFALESHHTAVS